MLTATKGTAVLNTIFKEYAPWCGDILTRENGSLVGHETGQARRAPWGAGSLGMCPLSPFFTRSDKHALLICLFAGQVCCEPLS